MKKALLVLGLLAAVNLTPAAGMAQSTNDPRIKPLNTLEEQSDEAVAANKKKAEVYLKDEYYRARKFAKFVIINDRCVSLGKIPPKPVSGETKYKAYVEKESKRPDPLRPATVTDKEVADSLRKSYQDMQARMKPLQPVMMDSLCLAAFKQWKFTTKKFGVGDEE